jgi:hypothetical protein
MSSDSHKAMILINDPVQLGRKPKAFVSMLKARHTDKQSYVDVKPGDFVLTREEPHIFLFLPSHSDAAVQSEEFMGEGAWCLSHVTEILANSVNIDKFISYRQQTWLDINPSEHSAIINLYDVRATFDEDEAESVANTLIGVSKQAEMIAIMSETHRVIFGALERHDMLTAQNIAHEHEKFMEAIAAPSQELGVKLKLFDQS